MDAVWSQRQGCTLMKGTSEAGPVVVRQEEAAKAVGGRFPLVTNAIEAGTCGQGDSGWA